MKLLLPLLLSLFATSSVFADPSAFFSIPSRGARTSRKLMEPFQSAWTQVLQSQFPTWTWDFDPKGKAPSKARTGSEIEALSNGRPGTMVFSVCLEEAQRKKGRADALLSSLFPGKNRKSKDQDKSQGSHLVRLRVALDGLVRYDERHRSQARGYAAPDDTVLASEAGRRSSLHLLKHWAKSEGIPWKKAAPPANTTTEGKRLTPEQARSRKPLGSSWGARPSAKPPVAAPAKRARRPPR